MCVPRCVLSTGTRRGRREGRDPTVTTVTTRPDTAGPLPESGETESVGRGRDWSGREGTGTGPVFARCSLPRTGVDGRPERYYSTEVLKDCPVTGGLAGPLETTREDGGPQTDRTGSERSRDIRGPVTVGKTGMSTPGTPPPQVTSEGPGCPSPPLVEVP